MNWSRIERWIWYAFLVIAPWQTRMFFWQSRPFSEWLSGALWLSDVCIIGLMVLALTRGWRPKIADDTDRILVLVVAAAALSVVTAVDRVVSIMALARLAEFGVFFLYLRQWAFRHADADASVTAFITGALLQAGLGIAQYALQHDVGIRFMGETLLRTDLHGVAVFFDATGAKLLRVYGTFPHPNVLAAWLFAALAGLVWLFIRHGSGDNRHQLVWAAGGVILLWGLYLTFARTVIAAGALASVVVGCSAFRDRISRSWPNIRAIRQRLVLVGIVVLLASVVFLVAFWPSVWARAVIHSSDEAVQLRLDYARDALSTGRGWNLNWTGVGIGGFVPWLMRHDPALPSYLYQPAHSLPLLAYAETGILGVAALVAFLAFISFRAWRAHAAQPLLRVGVLALFGALVFISLTDHFFWTLQQGRILWWLVLALAAGRD